ncbi:MAG: hypothetical protein RLY30_602 [Pseudomonadota bacterium]
MPSPTQRVGRDQECHALAYLREQGLCLIEQNATARGGEIDLILRHGAEIVFVEVRMRQSLRFGGALASVQVAKQKKLKRAARLWWARAAAAGRISGQEPCRFDVVAIESGELFWHRHVFE